MQRGGSCLPPQSISASECQRSRWNKHKSRQNNLDEEENTKKRDASNFTGFVPNLIEPQIFRHLIPQNAYRLKTSSRAQIQPQSKKGEAKDRVSLFHAWHPHVWHTMHCTAGHNLHAVSPTKRSSLAVSLNTSSPPVVFANKCFEPFALRIALSNTLIAYGSRMCWTSGPAGMSDAVMTPRKKHRKSV